MNLRSNPPASSELDLENLCFMKENEDVATEEKTTMSLHTRSVYSSGGEGQQTLKLPH